MLDGVSLHIGGGYWGTLGVSVFKENGLFLNPCRATAFVWGKIFNILLKKSLFLIVSFFIRDC